VPAFDVSELDADPNLSYIAADQLTTLAVNSDRFVVIERTQLHKLLEEQSFEGPLRYDELPKFGRIRGVDYLLIGKVTALRVRRYKRSTEGWWRKFKFLPDWVPELDFYDKRAEITWECGVELRLVDPTTGVIVVAASTDYKMTDQIGALDIRIEGIGVGSDGELKIDDESRGKLLRLTLADALRKMLPKVDNVLLAHASSESSPL